MLKFNAIVLFSYILVDDEKTSTLRSYTKKQVRKKTRAILWQFIISNLEHEYNNTLEKETIVYSTTQYQYSV